MLSAKRLNLTWLYWCIVFLQNRPFFCIYKHHSLHLKEAALYSVFTRMSIDFDWHTWWKTWLKKHSVDSVHCYEHLSQILPSCAMRRAHKLSVSVKSPFLKTPSFHTEAFSSPILKLPGICLCHHYRPDLRQMPIFFPLPHNQPFFFNSEAV